MPLKKCIAAQAKTTKAIVCLHVITIFFKDVIRDYLIIGCKIPDFKIVEG